MTLTGVDLFIVFAYFAIVLFLGLYFSRTSLLLGVPVLGIWYWCTDQVIVQRVLGAKNIHHAKMGTIFAAFLKALFWGFL